MANPRDDICYVHCTYVAFWLIWLAGKTEEPAGERAYLWPWYMEFSVLWWIFPSQFYYCAHVLQQW